MIPLLSSIIDGGTVNAGLEERLGSGLLIKQVEVHSRPSPLVIQVGVELHGAEGSIVSGFSQRTMVTDPAQVVPGAPLAIGLGSNDSIPLAAQVRILVVQVIGKVRMHLDQYDPVP